MEDTSERENPPSEYKGSDEKQGGIRGRLRDRDVLKKKKAEAEEKTTNQETSSRKRKQSDEKSCQKRRGRPKKSDTPPDLQCPLEEPLLPPDQPQPPLEQPQQEAPLLEETKPEGEIPYLALPSLTPYLPVTSYSPEPQLVFSPAPAQGETLYTEPRSGEQVLVEDLGPDEEEDIPVTPETQAVDQGPAEEVSVNVPDQNNGLSGTPFASLCKATSQEILSEDPSLQKAPY